MECWLFVQRSMHFGLLLVGEEAAEVGIVMMGRVEARPEDEMQLQHLRAQDTGASSYSKGQAQKKKVCM